MRLIVYNVWLATAVTGLSQKLFGSAFQLLPYPSLFSKTKNKIDDNNNVVCHATVPETEQEEQQSALGMAILDTLGNVLPESKQYTEMFGLTVSETAIYALFRAMRDVGLAYGLHGQPFLLRKEEIEKVLNLETEPFDGFFTINDLEKALEDDFLDAARGSTDNRKGWQVTAVSNPRDDSFEGARMTFQDVQVALDKGTVIFNAAGAHIPKLAGPSLACTDACATPNALNLYVTAAGKRTSAPPHTDKQDVVVIQTSGRKHWRVYEPPDSSLKPMADIFARGKGDDNLPLHTLDETGNLLLETTLNAGDVLFVPAAFPHTTSTATDASKDDDTSLHLTFNIDTHVWDLDYLSARRLALRRACVKDIALGQTREEDNRYIGKANELPLDVRKDLFSELPLGLLDEEPGEGATVAQVAAELERISKQVDPDTATAVDPNIWVETIERIRQQGIELLEIHRDMYLAALEEGRLRESEDAMTAHIAKPTRKTMTPERMQRLSLFRVQRYYELINKSKLALVEWSISGKPADGSTGSAPALPENWAFTMPVKVGDSVEADLGGAFFPATVTRVVGGNKFDVKFFDGDMETGLDRSLLKLLAPPQSDEVDTSNMTPKELKRWRKQQEKKNKKL